MHQAGQVALYLAGTAKETLIPSITDFKNEGLVHIKDEVTTVLKVEKLRGLTN